MGKILITGTGRCGSSFLVHLLSALGQDTGYTEQQCKDELSNECRGGCEHTIDKPFRILKNPEFSVNIESIIRDNKIDHVIIPIREILKTALSREKNNDNHGGYGGFHPEHITTLRAQMDYNTMVVYSLIEQLTKHNIPFTTIHFPRMVEDSKYLRDKLLEVFKSATDYKKIDDNFYKCFGRIADTKKITV